jgi:RHS repeat-associated protein
MVALSVVTGVGYGGRTMAGVTGARRRHFVLALALVLVLQPLDPTPTPAQASTATPSPAPAAAPPPQAAPTPLAPLPNTGPLVAPGDVFEKGDVLVATGSQIQWRRPDWTLVSTIFVGGSVGDMAFDPFGNLYVTDVSNGRVQRFNAAGTLLGTFAAGLNQPSGIDVDSTGNVVVGERITTIAPRIRVYAPGGQLLANWFPSNTVMYADLASDDCTLRYTPNSSNFLGDTAFSFDICTGANGVAASGHGGSAGPYQQIDGRANDGMLIAFVSPFGFTYVDWYSADGELLDVYSPASGTPDEPDWLRAVANDPDGVTFWTGSTAGCSQSECFDGGKVYHVDLATGTTLSVNATGGTTILALAVVPAPPGPPEDPPPPGTESNLPQENQANGGDPVSTYTGALNDVRLDMAIPGRGPAISFFRTYNSNDPRVTTMGPGWTHSYNVRLVSAGDGTDDLVLVGPMGRSDRYVESGGTYTPPTGVHRSLVRNANDTFTAVDKSQVVWEFSPSGRLVQIRDRFGNASNITHDFSGRVATVSDPAGRGSLTFGYTGDRLTSVTDWASPARVFTYQYDAAGRLRKAIDREGKITTYAYDGPSHRLASVTDSRGNVVLTNTYDAEGRVVTQKDARGLVTGEATTFDYVVNPDGTRETTVTTPPTSLEPTFTPSLTDSYDANGWLVQRVTRPSSTETLTHSFTYDGEGNRTSVTNARGSRTDFCYDVDYAGNPISGGDGDLTRRIDPAPTAGADRPVTLITYDSENNVIQTIAPKGVPSGATVTCATDLSSIDVNHAVDFVYDGTADRLLSTTERYTDPDAGLRVATTRYEYSDVANPGLVTRVIPPGGNTGPMPDYSYATTFTHYDSGPNAGLLRDVTDPLGNRTSHAYDAVGRLTSTVDPLGNATGGVPADHTHTFAYDREDRLRFHAVPAPASGGTALSSETRYDEAGNPTVRIDRRGQVSLYGYDERNSLVTVTESALPWTDPANPPATVTVTEVEYDAGGNVSRITRAAGDSQFERVTDYLSDGRGLLRTEIQYPHWPSTAESLITTSTYDPNGNLLTTVDPLGQTTTFGYDALNRRTSVDYADLGTSDVEYAYDVHGNRTSMVDGTGTTTYAYDEADRLTSVTSPGDVTVGYRYDLDGNRTKLVYPDGTAVTYVFNKANQLASLTDWASRSVSYTYAQDGLVTTATNPNGSVASYAYDNARRLVDILHAGPGAAVLSRFTYVLDAVGNVTSVANGTLSAQFARPDSVTTSNGSWSGTWASIDETPASDADFLASPSGPTSSHFYEVSLGDAGVPHTRTGITLRYRYAKSGNDAGKATNLTVELRNGAQVIASQTHPNIPGVAGSGWQSGSLTLSPAQGNAITDFADLRIRFSPSSSGGGQKRSAQISWAELELPSTGDPASLITYTYDRLSRLTSAQDSSGTRNYTYDPVGNRLSAAGTTYAYDRADRITGAGPASIDVDANGNMTAKGSDTFDFDAANRMVMAATGGSAETYIYDGDGTRFSRQVGANPAIRYVSDVAAALPLTIADGTRKYVYGLGIAYAQAGSELEVFHTDRLGSVRSLTDSGGSVTASYSVDEWGNTALLSGSSQQPFGFTGEPEDSTGLLYLRARYYSPELGRFTTRDTWPGRAASPQTLNGYAYATGNPTTLADPSGHCIVDTLADALFILYDVGVLVFGPSKEQAANALALGADVGAAFVPCATGAGIIVRGGRAASNAIDAARAFGGLSRAAEFGITSYGKLRYALQGTGLQAHHLLEKRFAAILGQAESQMLSVAVTRAEHQAFTNAWRQAIPYGAGTAGATPQTILAAAREIYKDYPAILNALGL